jgi:hypothetical protein
MKLAVREEQRLRVLSIEFAVRIRARRNYPGRHRIASLAIRSLGGVLKAFEHSAASIGETS